MDEVCIFANFQKKNQVRWRTMKSPSRNKKTEVSEPKVHWFSARAPSC